jgi:hypothetical protein
VLTGSARRIGTFERQGGLEVDSSYTDSTDVTIPPYASGAQFLLVQTDSGNDVFEGNREGNNVVAIPLIIILDDPSDLIVENVIAPPAAIPGEDVLVSYTLTNVGPNRAVGTVVDAVYASKDEFWDIEDRLVATAHQQVNLAPGMSQKMAAKVDFGKTYGMDFAGDLAGELPGLLPGDYKLLVRTDVRNSLRETDDDNNTSVAPTPTTVSIDEITLDTPVAFTLTRGQRKYYALAVSAGEDLRLTLTSDDAGAANDIYVAYERVPSPGDFDIGTPMPNETSQEAFVPTTQAGTYYVMVEGRDVPSGSEQMQLLVEALGFTILSITPDEGGAGGRVTTTIRGAGFRETTRFTLSDGLDVTVAPSGRLLTSSVEAVVRFDLLSLEPGAYSILANDGSSSATFPFLIEQAIPLTLDVTTSVPDQIRERGRALIAVEAKNDSNVDIPYYTIRLDMSSRITIAGVVVDGDLLTRSEALWRMRELLGAGVTPTDDEYLDELFTGPDYYYWGDEQGNRESAVVEVHGKDLPPGDRRALSIEVSDFGRDSVFFVGTAVPMSARDFLAGHVEWAEAARQELLASGFDSVDPQVLDSEDFVRGYLALQTVVGVLDQEDLEHVDIPAELTSLHQGGVRSLPPPTASPSFSSISVGKSLAVDPETACTVNFYSGEACKKFATLGCMAGLGRLGSAMGSAFEASTTARLSIATAEVSSGGGAAAAGGMGASGLGALLDEFLPCPRICNPFFSPEAGDDEFNHCYLPVGSKDPNDIIGPAGFGDDRWIAFDDPLPYTIRFENDPVKATAAAQEVFVTQQLDSTLDWRSFRLGEFGFGENRFQVPENSAFYQTRIDIRDSLGLFVDFTGGIDITTGEAFWRFESVDPLTGELPWFDGFLPPNDTLGRGTGEGFVTYSIKPTATAQTRDIVNAEARIIFDVNEPIDTPPIFNTIDAEPPMSMVQPLSAVTDTSNFPVTWSLDDFGGSDAREFTLYASEDGGPFEVYRSGIADTSAIFVGDYEKDYSFFVVATDNTGNAEALKAEAEASTAVVRPVGIEDQEVPKEFALHQNYPNPFNPTTTIPFDIAKAGKVEITVYDVIGRRVLRADQGALTPGRYRAAFNLSHLASGVYVYRIRVLGESRKLYEAVNKFVLVK